MADDVVILQPGDERAKKVAKAMSSKTANDIIQALGKRTMTSTEIANLIQVPITTASYHIDNLLDAGILQVAERRWSKKGREVKVYSLTTQVLIIASPHSDLRSLLLKYMTLFCVLAAASLAMTIILPVLSPPPDGGMIPRTFEVDDGIQLLSTEPEGDAGVHQLVIYFFFGGCLALFMLMIYEVYYLWRTSPKRAEPSGSVQQTEES
ncbi:MAG: helix-turn-helix domain-containing protein [Methanomicrobiaceae archaeon]|uniref:Transcriptional regulator, arsr family n=1 Tax=hydrocarbon metagenome TaxID=938273 RepID=A0A0W8FF21_9ZZZZ|nr:helix-turn-helix domain-containing protein [Methanomicrobiaceae archaeon]MDD5420290.1 helix-turn-helix domain-containing protein [Methanomicrobiaceae archaeon]